MATVSGPAGEDLPAFDANRPTIARIYDYLLGGTENFEADRVAAREMIAEFPPLPQVLRTVRAFVRRATRFLAAEAGVRQFLDLGAGIPTVENVHDIAQGIDPAARVVYVDIDPLAVAHGQRILEGNPNAACVQGDLRRPGLIIADPDVLKVLDFSRPVAVMMSAVLHFIAEDDEAARIVGGYLDAAAAGSYLLICHAASEGVGAGEARARAIYSSRAQPLIPRSRAQITALFAGTELVPPGVVLTPQWRPGPDSEIPAGTDDIPLYFGYAGVGRKP